MENMRNENFNNQPQTIRYRLAMGGLLKSRTFLFVILMLSVVSLYYIFGVQEYVAYDVYGQQVTTAYPNVFGVLIVMLPLVVVAYMYWKKWRGSD